MIQANELRIGNWILENTAYCQVLELLKDGLEVQKRLNSLRVRYHYLEPIPLTPEILESCGFEHYSFAIDSLNGIYIGSFVDGLNLCDKSGTLIGRVPLRYLHQLQNLYFALTGEELKINLNVAAIQ